VWKRGQRHGCGIMRLTEAPMTLEVVTVTLGVLPIGLSALGTPLPPLAPVSINACSV